MARFLDIARILARLAWAAVGVALVVVLLVDVRPAIQSWGAMPQQITDLTAAVEAIPDQVIGQVLPVAQVEMQATREEILAEVDKQATAITAAAARTSQKILEVADTRLDSIQTSADKLTIDIAKVDKAAISTLSEVSATMKDARDSWDSMYDDVNGLLQNASVATHGIAVTADVVAQAAPKIADSVVGIGNSADGIAADIHTATSDFVRPKTFWGKLKSVFETAGKVAARLI